ncbi:hypothetical protein [Mycolicibacterium sp.]|uniref:hypothetical protein n=1 Tax=Mycolicibacterium sp. TaxID=2320850 RepID=UPI001A24C87E|nr:hypothetical protein [Mycolicibacterium sp.]MBJ7336078.1 hypothetical protein [Mycolicibacterium sp.]
MPAAPAPDSSVLTWVGRAAAVLAAFSAALHAASLGHVAHHGGPLAATAMVAMICGCLWCARHLWGRAAPADWAAVAVMSLVMIALHVPIGVTTHVHSASLTPVAHLPVGQAMPLMSMAVMAAVTEAAIATIALVISTNLRNRRLFQVP